MGNRKSEIGNRTPAVGKTATCAATTPQKARTASNRDCATRRAGNRKCPWLALLLAVVAAPAAADSLWRAAGEPPTSLIADTKARRVGDLLTILIKEESTATTDLKEKHAKDTKTKAIITEIKNIFGYTRPDTSPGGKARGLPSVDWQSSRKYDAESTAESKKKLELRIAAIVKEVRPNGTLLIEGTREIRHDRDVRLLHISGIVRPIDIAADNTVASEHIAQARVSYENKGPGARTKNKGWGNWIVDIIWPF